MSEEELNEQYIGNKIGGICQDCMWLDKTIPIIREMLSKAYIDGLEQSRFDKKMLEIENQQLKNKINKIIEVIDEKLIFDDVTGTTLAIGNTKEELQFYLSDYKTLEEFRKTQELEKKQ